MEITCPYARFLPTGISPTQVLSHVNFFSEQTSDKLTPQSMRQGHTKIGQTGIGFSSKIDAITQIVTKEFKKPLVLPSFSEAPNPASSGIWHANGTLDEKMLDQVVAQCSSTLKPQKRKCNPSDEEEENEIKVIRKELIMKYLEQRWKDNAEADKVVAHAWSGPFGMVKIGAITWKMVTTGSFNDLFNHGFDCVHYEDGRTRENVLSESWFRLFYTAPNAFWSQLPATMKTREE